ncbi:hypothetical protein ACFSBS_17235 [Azospirillum griseum]|uniref:Uncharacterized protein n=1 Tax=Azospirillum griseum TaxID=2496639 RepID=A0A3S0K7M0_9PROT|nr:hypothetical protein EJ903_23450 [Azospirillum griseum]
MEQPHSFVVGQVWGATQAARLSVGTAACGLKKQIKSSVPGVNRQPKHRKWKTFAIKRHQSITSLTTKLSFSV